MEPPNKIILRSPRMLQCQRAEHTECLHYHLQAAETAQKVKELAAKSKVLTPWVPHGGRQDLTPESCPLASMPWYTMLPSLK